MNINLSQIKSALPQIDVIRAMEEAFIAYSNGDAVVPPVGELILDAGEVHIKYGYIRDEEYYVIKVASGFYGNPKIGLSSGNGLMLLFKQSTGELASILLDEGHLTDARTAAAGAVAAKYLAPKTVEKVGIVGTGTQAKLQLSLLKEVVDCREALVWGRGQNQLNRFVADTHGLGFDIQTTLDTRLIPRNCNLIVTTTPSEEPLIMAEDIRPGTHITAVGSDTVTKQELESDILMIADLVVADSINQCIERGEIHKAMVECNLPVDIITELGNIVSGAAPGRTTPDQITVADLTGVAVQDIKIAEAVYARLTN